MMHDHGTTQSSSGVAASLIFNWRGHSQSPITKLISLVLAVSAFAFLLIFVRIKVASPQFNITNKASLIHLPATGEGLVWARRAIEGGPWLARYEPASWYPYATLATEALQATRIPAREYVPALRALPQQDSRAPLQALWEPVFPQRAGLVVESNTMAESKLAPVLYPLSTLGATRLPSSLPPFMGEIDAVMAAADWRFLLRLHSTGGVAECVSLTKAAGPGLAMLETWLRGVAFDAKLAPDGGWLAVGIKFNNQAKHGTDTR
jgi:hypothetical protein